VRGRVEGWKGGRVVVSGSEVWEMVRCGMCERW